MIRGYYCTYCKKQTPHEKKLFGFLDLLLTIVTLGFWLVVRFVTIPLLSWQCSQCGSFSHLVSKKPPREQSEEPRQNVQKERPKETLVKKLRNIVFLCMKIIVGLFILMAVLVWLTHDSSRYSSPTKPRVSKPKPKPDEWTPEEKLLKSVDMKVRDNRQECFAMVVDIQKRLRRKGIAMERVDILKALDEQLPPELKGTEVMLKDIADGWVDSQEGGSPLPEYSVVDEKVSDTPLKTQIEQHIIASGTFTKAELEAEILRRYREAKSRSGFRHHRTPTNVYIYAYGTEDQARAGMGLWIGMIAWTTSDRREPRVQIDENRLASLSQPTEERFGLSEQERKKIFRELALVEDRAMNEAMSRIPDSQINRQVDLQRELERRYKAELARKYGITAEQLQKIMVEGATNGWPY